MSIWQLSSRSLLAWAAAFAIIEPVSYFVIPATSSSKAVADYYNIKKTSVPKVVFGDFMYSTFLYMVTLGVLEFVFPNTAVTWITGFLVFMIVQWIGDLSWFAIITYLLPDRWVNEYVNFFRRYGGEISLFAPLGDSLYGLVWFALAAYLMSAAPTAQIAAISLFLFGCLVLSN
jgi:hypothetical protein